jgi:hypothetical protein
LGAIAYTAILIVIAVGLRSDAQLDDQPSLDFGGMRFDDGQALPRSAESPKVSTS